MIVLGDGRFYREKTGELRDVAALRKGFALTRQKVGSPRGVVDRGMRICLTFSNPKRWKHFLISPMECRAQSQFS